MELKESQFKSTETPKESSQLSEEQIEKEKSPEKKQAESLILDINRLRFWFDDWSQARYRNAKREILEMGDTGVDLIIKALKEQKLSLYCAVELLKESSSEKSIPALESLLASDIVINDNDADRSATFTLLLKLQEKDQSSSIPVIVRFAEHYLDKISTLLEEKDVTVENIENQDIQIALSSIEDAINGLQKFTDREGFRQAEKLYEDFNKIQNKINTVRQSERVRLKEFLDKPYEVNLKNFPGASPEEAEQINQRIAEIQNSPILWDQHLDHSYFGGEQAVPFIYQAIKDGRLSGHKAWRTLERYPIKKLLPLYHGLLLDAARSGVSFFQRDILDLLESAQNPESAKIIAEFIRKSAELALSAQKEDQRLELQSNVEMGLRILSRFNTDEAKNLGKLLSFSYPEFSIGYEVLKIPKIEKPKTKEQRKWAHTKMYIRGSAIFAEVLGRGKDKVHDLDVFITNSDSYATAESMRVGNFESINDLENILAKKEFDKLKTWIEKHEYVGKTINLVRMPESHLTLEETFEGEPKLLLWDNALEGEINVNRYASEDLQSYQEGQYLINPEFPEKLIPRGTLTRALRTMDLAERLSLKYDETILNQAENAAKNSKLIISSIPANRLIDRHELSPAVVLDPTFIKVFTDKKLRKPLLRKFPRLGQLAEEITKSGSVEKYIKENYGEVYLQTRRYARLYDINLSKSPASLERQKEFIQQWYAELGLKDFTLFSVEKTTDVTALPKPEGLGTLIDPQELQSAIEQRKNKNTFLDKLKGRYRVTLDSSNPYELNRKIELFLRVMNMDWPANMEMDKRKVSQTLIRLGIHSKNPILSQFDSTKRHEMDLVISAEPADILQASTDKPWHSCTCIKSYRCKSHLGDIHYSHSLYEDVGRATIVAYLVKDKDFIARKLIRAGFTLDNFEPAAAIEKLYGDQRYEKALGEAVKKIIAKAGIKTGIPMITYQFKDAYFDSDDRDRVSPAGNHFYYSPYR